MSHRLRQTLGPGPRRSITVAAVAGAVIVIAVAAAVVVRGSQASVGRVQHSDGEGALQSDWQHGGSFSLGVSPAETQEHVFTFGLRLCSADGSPVTVQGVGPIESTGDGFSFVGAMIHVIEEGHDEIIGGRGFPPAGVSGVDVGIAVVDISCSAASGPGARHDELLIGLERTNASGGGWNGLYVDYAVGGKEYRLLLRDNIAVCGVATDSRACAQYRTGSVPPSK